MRETARHCISGRQYSHRYSLFSHSQRGTRVLHLACCGATKPMSLFLLVTLSLSVHACFPSYNYKPQILNFSAPPHPSQIVFPYSAIVKESLISDGTYSHIPEHSSSPIHLHFPLPFLTTLLGLQVLPFHHKFHLQ